MKRYLNYYFLVPYLISFIISVSMLLSFEKGVPELYINSQYNNFFDWFFYLVTELGAGWFFGVVILFLFIAKQKADALLLLIQIILIGIFIFILKHVIFTDMPRPPQFFKGNLALHFVKGSGVFYSGSFPSGHNVSGYCLFSSLALIVKRKEWGFLFCLIAISISISRIYLLKHFLIDVNAGSLIGILISLLTFYFFHDKLNKRFVSSK